jgi:hypothetical protein
MSHWCEECFGITTGGSPCAPEPEELPERECDECGALGDWEETHCPACDAALHPTLAQYLAAKAEDAAEAKADYLYDLQRERDL